MTINFSDCVEFEQVNWDKLGEKVHRGRLQTWDIEASALVRLRDVLKDDWERVVHTDPCDAITGHGHDGAPDFLIQKGNGVLGIEITTLTIGERARRSHIRSQILSRAWEIYRNGPGPKCFASVHFEKEVDLNNSSIGEIAREIAKIVEELAPDAAEDNLRNFHVEEVRDARHFRKVGWDYDEFLASLEAVTCGVRSISVIRYPDIPKTQFAGPGSAFTPLWGETKLREFLAGKVCRASAYREHCDELWLLAVYGVERSMATPTASMGVDLADEIKLDLPFDRVLALKGANELRVLQGESEI